MKDVEHFILRTVQVLFWQGVVLLIGSFLRDVTNRKRCLQHFAVSATDKWYLLCLKSVTFENVVFLPLPYFCSPWSVFHRSWKTSDPASDRQFFLNKTLLFFGSSGQWDHSGQVATGGGVQMSPGCCCTAPGGPCNISIHAFQHFLVQKRVLSQPYSLWELTSYRQV